MFLSVSGLSEVGGDLVAEAAAEGSAGGVSPAGGRDRVTAGSAQRDSRRADKHPGPPPGGPRQHPHANPGAGGV